MIEINELYFKWLMERFGDTSGPFQRLCHMLDQNVFQRRVGNDVNRADDGYNLRRRFLDDYDEARIHPRITNDFLNLECSWLEMMIALADRLDYMYDGGVKVRFMELVINLGLTKTLFVSVGPNERNIFDEVDQDLVDAATSRVDNNLIDRNGRGGMFPLDTPGHPDQREVEIWAQHSAYFSERLEEA